MWYIHMNWICTYIIINFAAQILVFNLYRILKYFFGKHHLIWLIFCNLFYSINILSFLGCGNSKVCSQGIPSYFGWKWLDGWKDKSTCQSQSNFKIYYKNFLFFASSKTIIIKFILFIWDWNIFFYTPSSFFSYLMQTDFQMFN